MEHGARVEPHVDVAQKVFDVLGRLAIREIDHEPAAIRADGDLRSLSGGAAEKRRDGGK